MEVLIPKGNGGFRGIRLMGVIWEAVLGVLNFWIGAAVNFHYMLHSSRVDIVMGDSSPEVNLPHYMEVIVGW